MSISLSDARIQLAAEPSAPATPALEVAMPGHCPGRANWLWLLQQRGMVAQIEAAGYAATLDQLRQLREQGSLPEDADIAALTRLIGLPVPLGSLAQFQVLFPEAFTTGSAYRSRLAGNAAWLPLAVRDFFARSSTQQPSRLWIIPVREAEQQRGFLPHPDSDWLNNRLLGAFDRALALPDVGLVALPDLERLQIPAELPDTPRLRLPNPAPAFLPCGNEYDDTHRERRHSHEMPRPHALMPFSDVLNKLSGEIARRRPDMHLLLSMPLDEKGTGENPAISARALQQLRKQRDNHQAGTLRRVQLLFPYLRSPTVPLASAAGVVAAEMAARTRQGAWLSVAARPLSDSYRPYPPLDRHSATALRDQHALGVLMRERGQLKLDDERLAAGVFGNPSEHARSGEVARFLGWLQRELRKLGERLIFDTDPRDPRPRILLESFFGRLHARGALRGVLPGEAFSIRQSQPGESALQFDIEIAPAFPIDRIRLSISRSGRDQAWQIGGLG